MKRKNNFKIELKSFLHQIPYEICIAFLLAALPVYIYSANAAVVNENVKGLLATETLIKHSALLIGIYALATGVRVAIRFQSDNAQRRLISFHKLTTEIGTSFLTIIRTGLGTMIGVLALALTTNFFVLSLADYAGLITSIFFVCLVSTSLAVFHESLANTYNVRKTKNSLILDPRLMK